MASFDFNEALTETLPGLFKAYTSGQGSLAPFFHDVVSEKQPAGF
jgi:hypothetical protein